MENIFFIIVLVIVNLLTGTMIAKTNVIESAITQDVTKELIEELILMYIMTTVICRFILRITERRLRMNILNRGYIKHTIEALCAKQNRIEEITVGAIFDTVKELSASTSQFVVTGLCLTPTLIPAASLIYREFLYDERCGWISIIALIGAFTFSITGDKLFHWNETAAQLKAKLQSITADNFMNLMTIKFMGFEELAMNRLVDAQKAADPYMVNKPKYAYFRLVDIMNGTSFILNLWLCRDNIAMVGLIIMAQYSLNNIVTSLADMADLYSDIKSEKKIIVGLKETPDKPIVFEGCVLNNIKFGIQRHTGDINDDVICTIDHAEINKGDVVLVKGTSGSGKSLFAKTMAGVCDIIEGDLKPFDVFYVCQTTTCLNDTLWNNIVGSNEFNVPEYDIYELMKKIDMWDWFCTKREGMDAVLGEHGCFVSSGQLQRINILRTILALRYTPHKLFILDEITSNLDDKTRNKVIELFREEIKSSTVIFISHNDGFDSICNRELYCDENHNYTQIR